MKIPFDIKFRPQIESGEYKVETKGGAPARIVCWDLKHDFFCLVGLVGSENELIFQYTEKGRFYPDTRTEMDLVLVIPEETEQQEITDTASVCKLPGGLGCAFLTFDHNEKVKRALFDMFKAGDKVKVIIRKDA